MESIAFVGIQATGKSSFYKERFFRTHVRINLDMLRTRHRERILLHACIETGQPFVVDNTNPTVAARARYIQAARDAGFRVVGYYFQSAVGDAIRRNQDRPEAERVPVKGLVGTYKALQTPSVAEGFDQLFCVAIGDDSGFVVREWTESEQSAGSSETDTE